MLGRLGDAVKDAAETLRRAFHDPPAHAAGLGLAVRGRGSFAALEARTGAGVPALEVTLGTEPLSPEARRLEIAVAFAARVVAESAWEAWRSAARVAVMPVFHAEGTARVEIPPLPSRPQAHPIPVPRFATRGRGTAPALAIPGRRGLDPAIALPQARGALDLALGLPLAVSGEDLRNASRVLLMRFTLQMVKATGENARNLELLGRYRIPREGVRELRHDAASGRLLVWLEPRAAQSPRSHLLIARRRDGQGLLTCFSEED